MSNVKTKQAVALLFRSCMHYSTIVKCPTMRAFGFNVCWILRPRFFLFFFFFFCFHVFKERQILLFRDNFYCSYTVSSLFITVAVHILKNIKNGSHDTIYTFKNYFVTVVSVFSFSNNKFNPNGLTLLLQ